MLTQTIKILIVEDEAKIASFIQLELVHQGFTTVIEANGRKALDRIIHENFDLILLDVMLPEMDGVEICRRVREVSTVPIIMLTARGDIEDKVAGLDTGADDYITKPFVVPELLARIRAALRKHNVSAQQQTEDVLSVKNMVLFPSRYEVQIDGQHVELTKKEYDLLEYLVRHKNWVLDRERIVLEVWGYEYMGDTNVVDVYVRYLRSKLDEPFGQKYIYTVRGVGYVVKD
ncbi:MAG TPA: response regulator transcription factor [Methylomusa anaerophila]|uniref:Response regulator ArlR n=1 Tax=Methylomusa anaerophila TaxID=1930071 RepID=A0A348ANB0_9FIRM|nr:response regulator transcription factor [Methylomusa anaerophila]BBB92558.1 response regulator ArlR [Methylomusa anaerophila]HML87587.1 response regulator transcription factor [Methylomusa anaerophila]